MARVTNNLLLQGISGKIGPLVIRQVGGQTIVQSAENKAKRAPRSPKQQAHLDRMYQAQLYAKAQIRDPNLKALYATRIDQRRTSAYTVAIADYMNAPEILGLDARAYRGHPGDALRIQATDDFEVIAVVLRFLTPTGTLLETGPATLQPAAHWLYLTQQNHAAGTTCEVEAHDRPGNATTRSFTL
ncbi:hypothetical protein Q5H93_22915 [Hymenobacter sp. ASUV-10]|uniref:Uncharacterized protein n=1 Tax=Hymenobacter aranciens TaxID=3063996 RepID=A0ABT9BH68_9BACT|nr:hypothetical protein [Hymenobacter sp. ASUV-10]MDO7877609.1 hypothetical protein [Hymenobacter sp. ASUV-10]